MPGRTPETGDAAPPKARAVAPEHPPARPTHHEPRDPVATGAHLLDIALPDGVPSGSLVLSLGSPSCGFELVAKEFAARDHPVLYYSPDESADEVEAVVQRFDPEAEPTVVDFASRYYDHIVRTQASARTTTVTPAALEHVADVVLDFRRTEATIEDIRALHVRKVRNEPQYVGTTHYKPQDDGTLVRDTRKRI